MPLPNAIIIGAQKAGTTSLFDWISQHPDVFGEMSMKDFPFFVNDNFYSKGLNWFSKAFKNWNNEKIILHGYVNYIYFSKIASHRIYNDLGKNTKLIVVLRNPVDRAYSAFWQQKKVGKEDLKTFEEAIEAEVDRIKSGNWEILADLTYINHGFYSQQLKPFKNIFDKNLKIVVFEEMIENPHKIIKDIFDFLNVDTNFTPSFKKLNETGVHRITIIQKLLRKRLLPQFIVEKIPINTRIKMKQFLRELNIKKTKIPPMDLKTKKFLYEVYKNEFEILKNEYEIDIRKWKNY